MLQLFVYFVRNMRAVNDSADGVFSSTDNLDATLCISSLLFAHCYRWSEVSLSEYCEIFKVSLTEGFKCMNFIGRDNSLPSELKLYLYHTEGKLLMEDIWLEGFPEELFLKEDVEYTKSAMFSRLQHHAIQRVKDIGR